MIKLGSIAKGQTCCALTGKGVCVFAEPFQLFFPGCQSFDWKLQGKTINFNTIKNINKIQFQSACRMDWQHLLWPIRVLHTAKEEERGKIFFVIVAKRRCPFVGTARAALKSVKAVFLRINGGSVMGQPGYALTVAGYGWCKDIA